MVTCICCLFLAEHFVCLFSFVEAGFDVGFYHSFHLPFFHIVFWRMNFFIRIDKRSENGTTFSMQSLCTVVSIYVKNLFIVLAGSRSGCVRVFSSCCAKKVVHTRTYVRSLRASMATKLQKWWWNRRQSANTQQKNHVRVLRLCVYERSSIVADAVLIFLFHFFFCSFACFLCFLSLPSFFI